MTANYFNDLYEVNCNEHTEKKGQFTYLSWAFAVKELKSRHPTATWEVIRFDGLPFMSTTYGIFVEVAVTVEGVTQSHIHPVLDNRNKPIAQPTSFQINTSIQRCLVKAIALHGLGLYIYAGEDLPEAAPEQPPEAISAEQAQQIRTALGLTEMNESELCRKVRIGAIEELAVTRFDGCMDFLKKQAEGK